MPVVKVIQYTTRKDAADENERLVADVFGALADTLPEGLRYATLRLDDGVTFVHVALLDDEAQNPLLTTPAFARFLEHLPSRLEVDPDTHDASIVGSYRLLDV
jgi:hypothetical protein